MRTILAILSATTISLGAVEGFYPNDINYAESELLIFGKSYHTNRSYDWNENNYGLGLGFSLRDERDSNWEVCVAAGTYSDSFSNTAVFCLAGPRYTIGDRHGYNGSFTVALGPYVGSGYHGIGVLPMVAVGYDWASICVTGMPNMGSSDKENNPPTAMIATFLKFRLAEF